MTHNFTSISQPEKRVRRVYAHPSLKTLEFLKNFARTYSPAESKLEDKTEMILN